MTPSTLSVEPAAGGRTNGSADFGAIVDLLRVFAVKTPALAETQDEAGLFLLTRS
jgi:hypothetical protein